MKYQVIEAYKATNKSKQTGSVKAVTFCFYTQKSTVLLRGCAWR